MRSDFDMMDGTVASDILNNIGYDEMSYEQQKAALVDLQNSSVGELFERWLNWNGICGFGSMIMDALAAIREVDEKEIKRKEDLENIIGYMYQDELNSFMEARLITNENEAIKQALEGNDHIFCSLVRLQHGLSETE